MGARNTVSRVDQHWEDPQHVAAFWRWFKKNRMRIERLALGDKDQLPVYKEMTRRMHAFHPGIYPELSVDEQEYVLIVTADGRMDAMDPVMHFTELYPVIEGWRIQRFRKPVNDPYAVFEYQDLICALEEVRVAYVMDEAAKKVHVALVIDGATRDDLRWHGMLYLLLDHAIGEFNTMLHVGGLDLMTLEELPQDAQLITLDELRVVFEEAFY